MIAAVRGLIVTIALGTRCFLEIIQSAFMVLLIEI